MLNDRDVEDGLLRTEGCYLNVTTDGGIKLGMYQKSYCQICEVSQRTALVGTCICVRSSKHLVERPRNRMHKEYYANTLDFFDKQAYKFKDAE